MVNTVHTTIPGQQEGVQLGVKERQEREREAVARSILDAARDLFVAEGYQNVSIRKIADRIEYSPAAIYSYFPSKDDIFFALAEEGFRLLIESGRHDEPEDQSDPLAGLRRPFWTLFRFSRTHPEYFALMFVDRTVPRISRHWEGLAFVREMKAQIAERIQKAVDTGIFPPGTHPQTVFAILTAAAMGPSVMQLCNRLAAGDDSEALARDTIEAALTGLRAGSALTFHPQPCDGSSNDQ